jgi:hypothetical protein
MMKKSDIVAGLVGLVILACGFVSSSMMTALWISAPAMIVTGALAGGQSVTLKRMTIGLVLPVLPLVIYAIVAGHGAALKMAEANQRTNAVLSENSGKVRQDARTFTNDFWSGSLEVTVMDATSVADFAHNDVIAEWILRKGFDIGVAGRADTQDMNASVPYVDMWFAKTVVTLLSPTAARQTAIRLNPILEEQFGIPAQEIDLSLRNDFLDERGEYTGLVVIMCTIDAAGNVMSATGLPGAIGIDIKNIPEARQIVEACGNYAAGRMPTKPTKSIEI